MKVFIVGLGLMGASYAQGLINKEIVVDGYDKNKEVINKALSDGLIRTGKLESLPEYDLVILALYPKDNLMFVKENKHLFHTNQVLTDLSGTKSWMVTEIQENLPEDIHYISHHPMAGRETVGYDNKNYLMFKGANFLIVPTNHTHKKDVLILEKLAILLDFGKVTELSITEHDELIGFTSQLTHVLAVALVNSDKSIHTKNATGDSYRDLTRIAKINETMWTELFLENKKPLLNNIDIFLEEVNKLKTLIEKEDTEAIKSYLKHAKEKRKSFD